MVLVKTFKFSHLFILGKNRPKNVLHDNLYRNKTLRSVHFGVVVVELIKCKCGGIVRNELWQE